VSAVPWLKRKARLTSSSLSWVASRGMTKRGTPEAKSFWAEERH